MEKYIWNEFFSTDDNPGISKGTQSGQIRALASGTSVVVHCLFSGFDVSSIIIENAESRLLISDSSFEYSISPNNGTISFSTVQSADARTEFIMNRCCAFRCGCANNRFHFLFAQIFDDLRNRNYIIDSSIAWCGHTGSSDYIRRQNNGLLLNKRVNDSYCSVNAHSGPSFEGKKFFGRSIYLTISHNNATNGRFFHCVGLPTEAQYIVLDHVVSCLFG